MAKLKVLVANSGHYDGMANLNHSNTSNYAYRMQTSTDKTVTSFSFQRIKLPREAHLSYMRDTDGIRKSWNDASLIYAGMLEDVLVAYAVINANDLPGTATLTDLVVMPEVRHRGIGRTMLAAVESWAVNGSQNRVLLPIAMRNYPMIELAMQSGYEMGGFLEQYFPNGDPVLFFQKRLA